MLFQKSLQADKTVDELVFTSCKNFTSESFESLVALINPQLSSLAIYGSCSFNDATLARVCEHCGQLTTLSLSGTLKDITPEGIASVVKNCQQLKSLSISCSESDDSDDESQQEDEWQLGDELFVPLSTTNVTTSALEHFGLCGFDAITFDGLKKFLECVKGHLTSLDLSELPCVNDSTLTEIGNMCPNLTAVAFSHCKLTDTSIKEFCLKCKLLQTIDISGCEELTDNAIVSIARNCRSLKKINFAWCLSITEVVLDELGINCPGLESVNASQCAIKLIPYQFTRLSSLREVKAEGCSCLRCPPLNCVEKGLDAIRNFLYESHVQSRCRVAFVGNRGSGKSSLVLSLPTLALAVSDVSTDGVHSEFWHPFHDLPGIA